MLRLLAIVLFFLAACGDDDATDIADATPDRTVADAAADGASDADAAIPDAMPLMREACELVPNGFGPPGTVDIEAEVFAQGLEIPWSIGFLPNGELLVTERSGAILRIEANGAVVRPAVATIPIRADGEGGLLGLALHPDFATNRFFYVYYTVDGPGGSFNQVERWSLSADGSTATADTVVLGNIPAGRFHNGGRLRFGPDGFLYIGTGDAVDPASAQDVMSLAGKILRVADDGSIPSDNPFPGSATWIYGVRNTQGFDWLESGAMVMTDHGPSGIPVENGREDHDEINLVFPGDNLGWPTIYACETMDDLISPSMTWANAMPPGGTAVYRGTEIPEWQGDVFIGVLGFGADIGHLHRVRLNANAGVEISETYFLGAGGFGRLRDVIMGPDGGLYVTSSNCDGRGECGSGDVILRIGRQ
ncbi:MAG: PQQ-dependent sugar dehydrogenase [Myxococcota bacterium]